MQLFIKNEDRVGEIYDFLVSQLEKCFEVSITLKDSVNESLGTGYKILKRVKKELEKSHKCELYKKIHKINLIDVCIGATLTVKKEI